MKDKIYENIKIPLILIILYLVLLSGCKNKESDNNGINKVNNEKEEIKSGDEVNLYWLKNNINLLQK